MVDPHIGEIAIFAFNFAPVGWVPCDGRLLPINQNTALFSLIGTYYGGDGMTTFAVPDLRGRAPISIGQGVGLTNRNIGEHSGAETVVLTSDQMPAHAHTARASSAQANRRGPGSASWAQEAMGQDAVYSSQAPNTDMAAGSIASAGGGQAHSSMPPFLTLNFCMATTGVYPARP